MKAFLVFLVLALALAVSNPGLEQFVDWAANEMMSEHSSSEFVHAAGVALARPILKNITKQSNYGVLSVFTVDGVGEDKRYLGIARQFIALDGMELDIEGLEN